MTKQAEYHVTKLNLARHCLNFLISAIGINVLHLPYYICPVIWQSVKHWNPNCKLKFYHIDDSFFPLKKFNREDYILYPNYFGISWSNIQILAMKYPNLIVDNAQAFFAPPAGIARFYSLRKFSPAPSGSYL